jgi:hypothetical protein
MSSCSFCGLEDLEENWVYYQYLNRFFVCHFCFSGLVLMNGGDD